MESSPLGRLSLQELEACIVLNAPPIRHDDMMNIFSSFKLRICADGGANFIYDTCPSVRLEPTTSPFLPDLVIGDLDSIRPEVAEFFGHHGVAITQIRDQDSTDLDKALGHVASSDSEGGRFIAILGSIGAHEGRVDQLFAVINSMYRYRKEPFQLVQIGSASIMVVLDTGKHRIQIPPSAIGRHCGLIPAFGKVEKITSSGLQWDLIDSHGGMSFGSIISTNNIIREEIVDVNTSSPVLFTITYR